VKTQRVNPGIPLTFTVDLHGFPVINIGRHGGFDSDENPKSKSRLDKRIPSSRLRKNGLRDLDFLQSQ